MPDRRPVLWMTAALILAVAAGCQPAAEFPGGETDTADYAVPPPPPAGAVPAVPADTGVDVAADASDSAVAPEPAAAPEPRPDTASQPPERDCRTETPARTPGTRLLTVFFTCGEEVRPVVRRVPDTRGVLRAALEELLRGPTEAEAAAGLRSFFSSATAGRLNYVVIGSDGVARIDFDNFSRVIPNASSSAGSAQLLGQLRATIFQFPTVRSATLSFDGDCDAFWNWLQRDCQPLTRE